MATVNIKEVSHYYDTHPVLNNIHLDIERGEFIVIVGPSGCGKSTLLRLIAGLEPVHHGSILINGKCVNKTPPALRDMAMVFQNYALYPHMTVYENMAYALKIRKVEKKQMQARVEAVAAMLQLTPFLHRKPALLSGGQRQRVAMGRAMVRSPSVFLFDEPLSNLDAKLRTEMRYEIKKIHQTLKTTCIYVTHDQTEAMTLADRIVVLHQGQIQQIDSPRRIYQSPATLFVAGFMGHLPLNFFNARVDLGQKSLVLTSGLTLLLPPQLTKKVVDGEPVVVGVRPEHMYLANPTEPNAIRANIVSVEDMGADKVVQLSIMEGQVTFYIRLDGEVQLSQSHLWIKIDWNKANVYSQQTGARLGGWNE